MLPLSRPHFDSLYVAAALLAATTVLSGCLNADKQTESAADDRGDGLSEVERAVIDRSEARWKSLLEGDIESVYEYTSPAYRSLTPLQRFQAQRGDAVQWTEAEVLSAQCNADRCIVDVALTYRLHRNDITHTRTLPETWILSDTEWWIHPRRQQPIGRAPPLYRHACASVLESDYMGRFQPIDHDTDYLLPPSVQDWLPGSHLVRYVVGVVETLEPQELKHACAGRGIAPYHPGLPRSLLIYSHASGTHSSRKTGRATQDSPAFRFIAWDQNPDHDTLVLFRRRFGEQFSAIFLRVLKVARAIQSSRFGTVTLGMQTSWTDLSDLGLGSLGYLARIGKTTASSEPGWREQVMSKIIGEEEKGPDRPWIIAFRPVIREAPRFLPAEGESEARAVQDISGPTHTVNPVAQ